MNGPALEPADRKRADGQRAGRQLADDKPAAGTRGDDALAAAARTAAERARAGRAEPEPTLGTRLGQIGILGWTIVVPTLLGLFFGRWLDRTFATGVFFSAPLLMVGAGLGFWFAWKWMHRS